MSDFSLIISNRTVCQLLLAGQQMILLLALLVCIFTFSRCCPAGTLCVFACVHLTAQCDPATLVLFSSEASLVNREAKWLLTTIFPEYFERKLQDFSLANQWIGYPAPRPLLSHMWTRSQVKKKQHKTTLKLEFESFIIKAWQFSLELTDHVHPY